MRLPALVIIATVGIGAGQAPIIQPQPANQPPRDVVKRPEATGTARIKGRVVAADRGTPMRRAAVTVMVFMAPSATRVSVSTESGACPRGNTSSSPKRE